eukprot:m.500838 g.500838  ORF g.500838 m.500838 type:complete len:350 (-) comp21836_c1_seq14:126-1175(-)
MIVVFESGDCICYMYSELNRMKFCRVHVSTRCDNAMVLQDEGRTVDERATHRNESPESARRLNNQNLDVGAYAAGSAVRPARPTRGGHQVEDAVVWETDNVDLYTNKHLRQLAKEGNIPVSRLATNSRPKPRAVGGALSHSKGTSMVPGVESTDNNVHGSAPWDMKRALQERHRALKAVIPTASDFSGPSVPKLRPPARKQHVASDPFAVLGGTTVAGKDPMGTPTALSLGARNLHEASATCSQDMAAMTRNSAATIGVAVEPDGTVRSAPENRISSTSKKSTAPGTEISSPHASLISGTTTGGRFNPMTSETDFELKGSVHQRPTVILPALRGALRKPIVQDRSKEHA